jgi:hypothetical protein
LVSVLAVTPAAMVTETVWFLDHHDKGIVFIFGIHILGGSGLATHGKWSGSGHFAGGGRLNTTQIPQFFIFFIVWHKNILPHTFILFYMCRIIFVLRLNPYFVTMGHCPVGGGATLK